MINCLSRRYRPKRLQWAALWWRPGLSESHPCSDPAVVQERSQIEHVIPGLPLESPSSQPTTSSERRPYEAKLHLRLLAGCGVRRLEWIPAHVHIPA